MNTTKQVLAVTASLLIFSVGNAQAGDKTGEKSDSTRESKTRTKPPAELDFFAGPRNSSPPPQSIYTGNVKSLSPSPAATSSSSTDSGRSSASKAD